MGRLAVLVAVLCMAAALASSAATASYLITQQAIGGAPLAKPRSFYRGLFPPPVFREQLEGGLERLTFGTLDLQVYFRTRGVVSVGIVTWNRRYRTAEGIGPCSPLSALRRAYASRLQPFRFGGRVLAYRLGRLAFTVGANGRVGSVQLSTRSLSIFTALNALRCGDAGA